MNDRCAAGHPAVPGRRGARGDRCSHRRARAVAVGVALCVALGGCSDPHGARSDAAAAASADTSTDAASTATSSTAAPATTGPSTLPTTAAPAGDDGWASSWSVGAAPLPLRPDGFGEVLATPEALVDRRLPTRSALAPPGSERFEHAVASIDADVAVRMGRTWEPGCPVGPDELRYVTVSFWGFDGAHHTGELVVHRDVVDDVVWVFSRLHGARFPIEEMRLITDADLDAAPTGDGNNTAAFICRRIRQGSSWSSHSYGWAIDINPFHNPYERDGLVLPELASAYLDRSNRRPGMVLDGDVVTRAFAEVGWHWGGRWRSPDHMHFSADGR